MSIGRDTVGGNGDTNKAMHIPVLLSPILDALTPHSNEIYLDGTFGRGGYSAAILDAADCKIIAIDCDPDAIASGQQLVANFEGRLDLMEGQFGDMAALAAASPIGQHALKAEGLESNAAFLDGIVLDLGVSSPQLDEAERGFSFQKDGPLDMRMAQSGQSAADVVNDFSEQEIADILYVFGEERKSRWIANAIVKARKEEPFTRTAQLSALITKVLGKKPGQKKHPATRSFQALRLYVNAELEQLVLGLMAAETLLKPDGRLVVVTFHSLEDRIVKRFMNQCAGRVAQGSRHLPDLNVLPSKPSFKLLKARGDSASEEELAQNPRSRSARIRAARRTKAAPMQPDGTALGLPKV